MCSQRRQGFDDAATFLRDVANRLNDDDVSDATATDVEAIVVIGGLRLQLGRVAASKCRPRSAIVEHELAESVIDAAIERARRGMTPTIIGDDAMENMQTIEVLFHRIDATLIVNNVLETGDEYAAILRRVDGSGARMRGRGCGCLLTALS